MRHPLNDSKVGRSVSDFSVADSSWEYKFCDNVSDCVAVTEFGVSCFDAGSVFDVDDFSGSGQLEVCDSGGSGVWCPEGFDYEKEDDECYVPEDACYHPDNVEYCNAREKNSSGDDWQFQEWLADDSCSNYLVMDGGDNFMGSCCFVTELHGRVYQYDEPICIFPGNDNPPVKSDGSPCP